MAAACQSVPFTLAGEQPGFTCVCMHARTYTNIHTHIKLLIMRCVLLISLHELVKHNENGLIFKDSQELAEQLRVRLLNVITAKMCFQGLLC